MYHRTLKELTALQSRREKQSRDPNHHPTPCPFLPKEEPPAATNPDDPTPQPPTPPELQKSQHEPTNREGEAPSEPRFTRGPAHEIQSRSGPTPQNAQNEPTVPPRPLIPTHETSAVPCGVRS
jgi:hypothetical protein